MADTPQGPTPPTNWKHKYADPVVVLTMVIVLSVIVLVAAAVLGIDKGVLLGMSRPEYARGLITYLFALVTIGIAVALVLSTTSANIDFNDRFQKGKEVLGLLLGVFGTIVGFYFATETNKGTQAELQSSSLDLTPQPVAITGKVTIRAVVKGGVPPYRFGVAQGKAAGETTDMVGDGGWIVKQLQLRAPASGESMSVYLVVEDANKKKIEQAAPIKFE